MLKWKNIFRRKVKSKLLDKNIRVVEAFKHNGKTYFMFDDNFKIPTGRALCALAIYEELRMRCTREYMELHVRAMESILSDPKKINVQAIAVINQNLKERLALVPFPDHIYKLASVTFFDETESPYGYDFKYNEAKINEWKRDPEMLDFFLRTQFKDLIPHLNTLNGSAGMYFGVAEKVNNMHQQYLQDQLSRNN